MEQPLILDFTGIEKATSSFMDELLGKLYLQYKEDFTIRIHLINMNETLMAMTNVVIGQRVENFKK